MPIDVLAASSESNGRSARLERLKARKSKTPSSTTIHERRKAAQKAKKNYKKPPKLDQSAETTVPYLPLVKPKENFRARMETNLDKWRALHAKMLQHARDLLDQPYGQEGLKKIDKVEEEFILRFNEYVKIYNESLNLEKDEDAIAVIEKRIKELEEEYEAIPLLYY